MQARHLLARINCRAVFGLYSNDSVNIFKISGNHRLGSKPVTTIIVLHTKNQMKNCNPTISYMYRFIQYEFSMNYTHLKDTFESLSFFERNFDSFPIRNLATLLTAISYLVYVVEPHLRNRKSRCI